MFRRAHFHVLIRALAVPIAVIAFASLNQVRGATRDLHTASLAASSSGTVTSVSGTVYNGSRQTPTTVIPNGLPPVSGATVSLPTLGISTKTSVSGQFTLANVPFSPPYTKTQVEVSAPGFGLWTLNDAALRSAEMLLTPILQVTPVTTNGQVPEEASATSRQAPFASPVASSGAGANMGGLSPPDSPCSNYFSNTTPPSTISVYMLNEGGGVQNYDFHFYVQHVLPNEWIPSWPSASLQAGAMAVKTYGWYWVNYWRGGSYNGQCYDVDDSTNYQYFCANCATYASTDNAVDSTWDWLAWQSGQIFETSYIAGSYTCARINGTQMYQDGSETCASDGYKWQQILPVFYDNITLDPPTAAAFAAAGQGLWTWDGDAGNSGYSAGPANLGVAANTSPSVVSMGNGEVAVAFVGGGTNTLWTWEGVPGTTGSGDADTTLGVATGTSPSIVSMGNGEVAVAFVGGGSNTLWTWEGVPGTTGYGDASTSLGVA